MKRTTLLTVLLLSIGFIISPMSIDAKELINMNGIALYAMQPNVEAGGECGCYYRLKGKTEEEAFVLYWPFYEDAGKIKVNGQIETLKIVQDDIVSEDYDPTKVIFKLSNERLNVSGLCSRYDICDGNEDCEISGYRGTMTIRLGQNELTAEVEGVCGC